jgi:hypothetical protein
VGLLLNLVLLTGALVVGLRLVAEGQFWRADFVVFYTGGAMAFEGPPGRLYDLDEQAACQQRRVPERSGRQGLLPFNYPPHTALPLMLLALLPWQAAFVVWELVQLALLGLLLRRLGRWTAGWDSTARSAAFVALLAFPPLFMTFQLGQVSLLALVCLLGFYDALRTGRPRAAAAWFVLGTVKPQLFIASAVLLVAARRWRVLALAAGWLAAWGLATTAVLGWSCWPGFLGIVRESARQCGAYGIDPLRMYNLKGVLLAFLGGKHLEAVNALSLVAAAAAVGAMLWVWRGPWRPDAADFDRRAGFTLLLGLLADPHLNPADALTFVAPALLFGRSLCGRSWQVFAVLAAASPLLFLLDTFVASCRPFVLFALGWTPWMAWELWRERAVLSGPRRGRAPCRRADAAPAGPRRQACPFTAATRAR